MQDVGVQSNIQICKTCPKLLKDRHKKDYSRRSDGRKPSYIINIVMWNLSKDCPVFDENGHPKRYDVSDQQRNIIDQVAKPLQSPDDNTAPLIHRKSDRNRNKKKEDIDNLHSNILENVTHGLTIIDCGEIGRGIETTKSFKRSEYIATYCGELVDRFEAERREIEYAIEFEEDRCYTYYFRYNEQVWCYDATEDDGSFGRLINHSKLKPNIHSKVEVINDTPYVYFKALKDIPVGTELRYDYGDRKSKLKWLEY